MARRRRKTRTHVAPADTNVPKSFVMKAGALQSTSMNQLVRDIRKVMEPNTASNLRERKGNKLKDFVAVAAQFSVSHLMLLTQSKATNGVNLRVGRIPRGPTVTFHVDSYSLTKDVLGLQKHPKSPGSEFKTAPLVVLNNFPQEQHYKVVSSVFQNLFPTIRVQKMKLAEARRVVLFNYNPETQLIEFRHYSITVKQVGISKSVKSIVQTQIPNLKDFNDVSDFIMRGAFASESDVEDAGESTVTLPQNYVGRGNRKSEQRAIRLVELGPRMQLKLAKIQEGLCEGAVIHHSFISKTKEEIKALEVAKARQLQEKAERRAEQERNVAAKQSAKASKEVDGKDSDSEAAPQFEVEDEFDQDEDFDAMDEDEKEASESE